MKKIIAGLVTLITLFAGVIPVLAAPSATFQRTLLPEVTNTYDLGSNSLNWNNLFVKNITLGTTTAGCLQSSDSGVIFSNTCASGIVGSGTTGQFPFYNTNGTTLTATSSLFISQAGKIGIGTTNPLAKLQIGAGFTPFSSNTVLLMGNTSASTDFQIGQDATHNLFFSWIYNATPGNATAALGTFSGNNPLLLQAGGGFLGVGLTAPATQLDVNGGSAGPDTGYAVIRATNSSATYGPELRLVNTGSGGQDWRIGSGQSLNSSGQGNLFFFNISALADLMVITPSGRVGMGTTNPTQPLDIQFPGAANDDRGVTVSRLFSSSAINTFGIKLLSDSGGNYRGGITYQGAFGSEIELLTFGNNNGNTNNVGIGGGGAGAGSNISTYGNLSVGTSYYQTPAPTNGAIIEGNVGIGTTTPTEAFQVQGPSSGSATKGTCFRAKDVGATTFTYWWYKAGVQTLQTTSCSGTGTTTITYD